MRILVTGASKGIGFATVKKFAEESKEDENTWRTLMRTQGRDVSETVDLIYKLAHEKKSNFWNPTHSDVTKQFETVYQDITGNNYMVSLAKKSKAHEESNTTWKKVVVGGLFGIATATFFYFKAKQLFSESAEPDATKTVSLGRPPFG